MRIDSTSKYRDEAITVDARQNKKGEYVLVRGTDAVNNKPEEKRARKLESLLGSYCLVVTRRHDSFGMLKNTILKTRSPAWCLAVRVMVDGKTILRGVGLGAEDRKTSRKERHGRFRSLRVLLYSVSKRSPRNTSRL